MATLSIFLASLLRPVVYFVLFVAAVAPITWLLYKIVPPGRVKIALFKVRSGPEASRRDQIIMTMAAIGSYLVLFGAFGLYMSLTS